MTPHVQDVVITGHDRGDIGLLVFLTEPARKLAPEVMVEHVRRALQAMQAEAAGSSQTPVRALLLPDAPSAAAGEITDKGYINQRLVLARRAAEVELLYSNAADGRIVLA